MTEEEIKFDNEYMRQRFGADHFKYMVDYADKRVIEELERIVELAKPLRYSDKHDVLLNRIKELKQD